jgi:hypothetical protein
MSFELKVGGKGRGCNGDLLCCVGLSAPAEKCTNCLVAQGVARWCAVNSFLSRPVNIMMTQVLYSN